MFENAACTQISSCSRRTYCTGCDSAHASADALPIDHAQAVVRQLLAQQQEESAGAAELEFGERPKPKPRVGPIAGAAHHRIPATTSDAVAAATAAAAAATAGIVRPHRQKGAAKAAAASPAPWGYAGEPSTISHSHEVHPLTT